MSAVPPVAEPLLRVEDLQTHFELDDRVVRSVDGVSFDVGQGRTVCIVGESGSGKSVTARSILGLVDPPGRVVAGRILWRTATGGPDWTDLASLPRKSEAMRHIRGGEISMVFQEPMASLSPMYTVGEHLVEAIRLHRAMSRAEAWANGLELVKRVGIARPEERMNAYSWQLSGGMCQRAMIAIALAAEPRMIIADEPTTALDVTTQARILNLFRDLQDERGMSILFITHDLGVVAEIADDVVVMYRGHVVEKGPVDRIFHDPEHAYTRHLLQSMPVMTRFDLDRGAA
jgi:ABC-type dipeptide/oligopeptide/nickel transport system ATPase component